MKSVLVKLRFCVLLSQSFQELKDHDFIITVAEVTIDYHMSILCLRVNKQQIQLCIIPVWPIQFLYWEEIDSKTLQRFWLLMSCHVVVWDWVF